MHRSSVPGLTFLTALALAVAIPAEAQSVVEADAQAQARGIQTFHERFATARQAAMQRRIAALEARQTIVLQSRAAARVAGLSPRAQRTLTLQRSDFGDLMTASTRPVGLTEAQTGTLASAAVIGGATLRAAIANVIEASARTRPLTEVLDEVLDVLFEFGTTDEAKAEFAVAMVGAARDAAARGGVPGYTADAAGIAAAEAVFVDAQHSSTLVAAIVDRAKIGAEADMFGGTMVLSAFIAAAGSDAIDPINQAAVRSAMVGAEPVVRTAQTTTTGGGGDGYGGRQNGGGVHFANFGFGGGGYGNASQDVTSKGQSVSPN